MNKRKIFKNISWLFLDKVIRILGGLIVGVWVARYLGPKDYGLLNYAITFVAFFTLFSDLGLRRILVRDLTKGHFKQGHLMGTTFFLQASGALVSLLLSSAAIFIVKGDEAIVISMVIVISISFIFQSTDIIDYYYQSKMLSKYVVVARNLAFIAGSGVKLTLILLNYSVIYFAFAQLIEAAVTALFLVIIYTRTNHKVKDWKFSKAIAINLIFDSWPLMISAFLITIHMKVDKLMIDAFLDSTEVGIYSVATKLSDTWYFIPGIAINTLMPYFVNLREVDHAAYERRLVQLYSLMFWMGAFVGIIVTFFGSEIIILLFGKEYSRAYEALIFNIWAGIFVSQAMARGIWMISENLQRFRLYNNIIAVIINIIGNYFLIPKYGISGAAIATLLTQGLGTWLVPFLWPPLRASTYGMLKSINPLYLLNSKK